MLQPTADQLAPYIGGIMEAEDPPKGSLQRGHVVAVVFEADRFVISLERVMQAGNYPNPPLRWRQIDCREWCGLVKHYYVVPGENNRLRLVSLGSESVLTLYLAADDPDAIVSGV